jgi:two-component system, OmpR family, response regulator ChvI
MKTFDEGSRLLRHDPSCVVNTDTSGVLATLLGQCTGPGGEAGTLPAPHIRLGKLRLDADCCRASWNGQDAGLTLGEYRLLHLLVSSAGSFVTYRALYDRQRGKGFIAGHGANGYWSNVRSAIKRIRQKFCACDPAFDEIENYTGFGYRWRKPD